ncbi:recombinase zinc beta ribbon domain-containing protein [Streptomyces sp. NPDC059743]|uniref:recombinase zinc beta ribbon domain-containing protein n=1 Tax=Streptomyces sp. NPDC059743 TaxID=3346928 RepID=UPI00364F6996
MIPADLAARARRLVSGHQMLNTAKPQTERRVHPLTGLPRCADCGHSMSYGGGSYECQYYSGGGACNKPASTSRPPLERYIVEAWAARLRAWVLA